MRRSFIILTLAAAVAACTPTDRPVATSPAVPAVSTTAGPGTRPVDFETAAQSLKAVCVDNYPGFKGTPAALSKLGFVQNPAFGTYYSPTYDMSVKLIPTGGGTACSLVFSSREKPDVLAVGLSVVAATKSPDGVRASVGVDPRTSSARVPLRGGKTFQFSPSGKHSGKSYYRALMGS